MIRVSTPFENVLNMFQKPKPCRISPRAELLSATEREAARPMRAELKDKALYFIEIS